MSAVLRLGLVVASHGRHCLVETPEGRRRICHPRGKKSEVVVGDHVLWQGTHDEGLIEKVLEPRRNLFYRQDEARTKSFAANLDQVLVLIAAEPEFPEHQLARALIAAEAERIAPIIALNKSDLVAPFERAWARAAALPAHGVRRASAVAAAVEGNRPRAPAQAPARQDDARAGPLGRRQEHADQPAGARGQRADRRDLASAEFGQAHHHQHHLVLGRQGAHDGDHRFARLPGIRPAPHRADAPGRPACRT